MTADYRLARLVVRLCRSESYRSYTGGVAYVDLRLLDAAREAAGEVLSKHAAPRVLSMNRPVMTNAIGGPQTGRGVR